MLKLQSLKRVRKILELVITLSLKKKIKIQENTKKTFFSTIAFFLNLFKMRIIFVSHPFPHLPKHLLTH